MGIVGEAGSIRDGRTSRFFVRRDERVESRCGSHVIRLTKESHGRLDEKVPAQF